MAQELGQAEGRMAEAEWMAGRKAAAGRALAERVMARYPVMPFAVERVAAAAAADDRHGASVRLRLRRSEREHEAGMADRAARSAWDALDMTR